MNRQYTVGSIFHSKFNGEVAIIARPTQHSMPFQFICFKSPDFMPVVGVDCDLAYISRVLEDYSYIGDVKDLDFESFIEERTEAKPL